MKVRDVMTKNPVCCLASDTIQSAARAMTEHDVAVLPVVERPGSRKLSGIITDRDICTAVADNDSSGEPVFVGRYMNRAPVICRPDDNLEVCERQMHAYGVRRIPVIDANGDCIGIVGWTDLPERAEITVRREIAVALQEAIKKHANTDE